MAKDLVYVGGIIAAKENGLLKDKIYSLCEMSAENAFRALQESGFLKNSEAESAFEYEKILRADEADIDQFAREYAPNNAVKTYIFASRDFHNAKALLKAWYLKTEPDKMLAPEGLLDIQTLQSAIEGEEVKGVYPQLVSAVKEAKELFEKDGANTSGAEVGKIFERGLYACLFAACKHNLLLRKLLSKKVDMINILIVMRSNTPEYAADNILSSGKIPVEKMLLLFSENGEEAERALENTYLDKYWKSCLEMRNKGLPFTQAERELASAETAFLAEHKYELKREQPFLYYYFRRRAENENVRIVLSCLLAGADSEYIKARLREF